MKVTGIIDIEDCLDGSFIKEILLDNPVTPGLIHHLGQMGSLQYFPHFPRPFFRVDGKGIMFKGIEGNNTIRITLFDKERLPELQNLIACYSA